MEPVSHLHCSEDARWHDGEPVTAADVIFTYGLMQADDFPGDPVLARSRQPVQMTATGVRTVEFAAAAV